MTTPDIPLNPRFVVARVDTIIKAIPVPHASSLPIDDKFVLSQDDKLEINACGFDDETNHYVITLPNFINGLLVWFAFIDDVVIK
jgi:hypothetical protein